MKFCKDCKHCVIHPADKTAQYATCDHYEKQFSDYPVNGVHQYSYCATIRGDPTKCGPAATQFEAKDEQAAA